MKKDLLLIWELIGETTELYVIDSTSEIGQIAIKSHNQIINSNAEDGDSVFELNDWLALPEGLESRLDSSEFAIIGDFKVVVISGFMY